MTDQNWYANTVSAADVWQRRGRVDKVEGDSPGGGGPTLPPVTPVQADLIPQAYGINTHYSFGGTYADDFAVTNLLLELGVRQIRDKVADGNNTQESRHRQLAEAGCKIHTTVGTADQATSQVTNTLTYINSEYGSDAASVFRSFGGVNEPNASGRPADWASLTLNLQKTLWDGRNARSNLAGIPILGPSLHDQVSTQNADWTELAATGISTYMDQLDGHHYQGGGKPTHLMDERISWWRRLSSTKTINSTEGGYNNGVGITTNGSPVSDDVAAVYEPRLLMEYFIRGIGCFWRYELIDNSAAGNEWNKHWGLVDSLNKASSLWVKRPAFHTMKRFLALLSDLGAPFTPTALNMSVSGSDANFKWQLAQKRNGKYYLLLWRDEKIYTYSKSTGTGTDLVVNPDLIQVNLQTAKPVKLYRPTQSSIAEQTLAATTNFSVSLAGEMYIAEIG